MPFRVFLFERGNRMQSAFVEHEAVLKAILEHDAEAAYLAMRQHVASSNARVMNYLQARSAQDRKP